MDPLVAITTLAAGGTVYSGLAWGLLTVALTLVLGRFFCAWLCPLGSLNQIVGWLGGRKLRLAERIKANRPSGLRSAKYYILIFFLAAAGGDVFNRWSSIWGQEGLWPLAGLGLLLLALASGWEVGGRSLKALGFTALALLAWLGLARVITPVGASSASLLAGFLDPLPLVTRSVTLVLLPLAGETPRHYSGAWFIAAVLLCVLVLNLHTPRFFCRYLCPAGALMALLSRWSFFRLGKRVDPCASCLDCEEHCQGACTPARELVWQECVLCLNCLEGCPEGVVSYAPAPSAGGEVAPDLTRRGLLWSLYSGALTVPTLRLGGGLAGGWDPHLVRPPGSLKESELLARCTRCGQCMRVCPTGVIQPVAWQAGFEGLWTPVLNFRIGGGCLVNCVACGHLCPTGAIRPLSLQERQGKGPFAAAGPIRMGTAFVDRGRCLPWAMARPCIVCQENCPVSPKAINTQTVFQTLRNGVKKIVRTRGRRVYLQDADLAPGSLAGGDNFALLAPGRRALISANQKQSITLAQESLRPGAELALQVRLQRPLVDARLCVGCGACEHECPVSGLRAIRVSGENQTREPGHTLLPRRV